MVRTSGPFLPSGRSAGSTGHSEPSDVGVEQARIVAVAREVPMRSAVSSSTPSAGSATKMTSTSTDVVELAAARLAHADDGEPALLVARPVLLARDGESCLQRGLGELREGLADGGHRRDRVGGGQVERRDAHQSPTVGDAQRVVRAARRPLGRDRPHELVAHPIARMPGGPGRVEPVVRVPDEVVDEGGGAAEHGEHPVPRLPRSDEVGAERGDAPAPGSSSRARPATPAPARGRAGPRRGRRCRRRHRRPRRPARRG